MIQPLGEQIIIKVITKEEVGGIIIPDQARGATMLGEKGAEDAVHFVEAEVVAVGPGKRGKGDPKLVDDMHDALSRLFFDRQAFIGDFATMEARFRNRTARIPLAVKPGDRILYHPAVISFDREVDGIGEGKHYIIREDSVLAVLEP